MRHGDDFDWLGAHYANLKAPEVILQGSWWLCTPFIMTIKDLYLKFKRGGVSPDMRHGNLPEIS